jgi:hypothetical protein
MQEYQVEELSFFLTGEELQACLDGKAKDGFKFINSYTNINTRKILFMFEREGDTNCPEEAPLRVPPYTREDADRHMMEDGSAVRRLVILAKGTIAIDWEGENRRRTWIVYVSTPSGHPQEFRHSRLSVACENGISYLNLDKKFKEARKSKPVSSE